MSSTEKDAILEKILSIQNENAKLHEQISALKAQQKLAKDEFSDIDDQDHGKVEIEANEFKEKLNQEENQINLLKKELFSLISKQQEIQTLIEDENNFIFRKLTPELKSEEELTAKFYNELLSKCKNSSSIDYQQLLDLVECVQKKRKSVVEKSDEHQKILRLIAFNKVQNVKNEKMDDEKVKKNQTKIRNQPHSYTSEIKQINLDRDNNFQNVFDNPLPCLMLSAPQISRSAERRRTLAGRLRK